MEVESMAKKKKKSLKIKGNGTIRSKKTVVFKSNLVEIDDALNTLKSD